MTTIQAYNPHAIPEGLDLPEPPPPLTPPAPATGPTVAEHARTMVAAHSAGALATLSADGNPWASLATYGCLPDGSPVFMLSTLAEHGRNVARDPRASLVVAEAWTDQEPLAHGRVTLVGSMERPTGEFAEHARDAHLKAVPSAAAYESFGDFSLWVLRVERVRWVGGYGRMDSAGAAEYAAAQPDPTRPAAQAAAAHLNDDHADALLNIARALAGYPDATHARCTGIDRYGLELAIETPRGKAPARVAFAQPVNDAAGLREATVELARRARGEVTR
ncbi:MAG TPA: DUF2470 domain-containing protein [Solirubrobacterales bacterium]|mgnify:CR=1 FL=1|jgi:hypothetical protein